MIFALFGILITSVGVSPIFAENGIIDVSTDKSIYSDGDIMTISGEIKNMVPGDQLSILIQSPNGNLVALDQLTVSSDNQFSTEIKLGGKLMKTEGTYTIKVQYREQSATTSFEFGGVVSSTTNTGRDELEKVFKNSQIKTIIFPYDVPMIYKKLCDRLNIDKVILFESEFWPNIIIETRKRNIPMVLINGRISAKSFARWKWAPGLIKNLLQSFTLCLGQSDTDVHRLNKLGASDSKNLGNLKFAAPPLPVDGEVLKTLKSNIGKRPIFLSASTHSGEE